MSYIFASMDDEEIAKPTQSLLSNALGCAEKQLGVRVERPEDIVYGVSFVDGKQVAFAWALLK